MNIKLKCDTFRCSLMDDTGVQEYPVIFINLKNLTLDFHKHEQVDDAAMFILKVIPLIYSLIQKIGVIKKKKDDNEAFMNTKASLNLEVFYFNMNVQQYEPLLEPWVVEFS